MIVKKLGTKLLIDSKLYVVLYRLAPLLLLLSPFLFLLLPYLKEKNDFQEPSLKIKLYDLPQYTTTHKNASLFLSTYSSQLSQPIALYHVPGLLTGECLAITYSKQSDSLNPHKIIQDLVSMLQKQSRDRNLPKSIIFLGYNQNEDLRSWLQHYHQKDGHFGVIRAALNLNLSEQPEYATASTLIYQTYGYQGSTVDTDFYFSIVSLLNLVGLKHKPCQTLGLNSLRTPLEVLSKLSSVDVTLSNYLLQRLYCSVLDHQNPGGHAQLLYFGIQSVTLKTLRSKTGSTLSSSSNQNNNKRLTRLVYSWIKMFSYQEDNLHSSSTLWYPIDQYSYVSVKFYIIPPLVFLAFAAIRIICSYYTRGLTMIRFRVLDLLVAQLVILAFSIHPLESKYRLILVGLSLVILTWTRLFGSRSLQEIRLVSMLLSTASMLTGVYFLIYYLAWSLPSALCTTVLLFVPCRKIPLLLLILLVVSYFYTEKGGGLYRFFSQLSRIVDCSNIGVTTLVPLLLSLFV